MREIESILAEHESQQERSFDGQPFSSQWEPQKVPSVFSKEANVDFRGFLSAHLNLSERQLSEIDDDLLYSKICELMSGLLTGLLSLLQAQKQMAHHCHVSVPLYQPMNNNPLEHAMNAKHAFELLLREKEDLFLSVREAVPQSFNVLSVHQSRLHQSALKAMKRLMTDLEPAEFLSPQEPRMPWSKSKRYRSAWESYEKKFESMQGAQFERTMEAYFSEAFRECSTEV